MTVIGKNIIGRTIIRVFLIVTLPIMLATSIMMTILTGDEWDLGEWWKMLKGGYL